MNYEKDIIDLVGLQTYKALFRLFPELYWEQYTDDNKLSEYYIHLVQAVLLNTGYTPEQFKEQLIIAAKNSKKGEEISNMKISKLFGSSPVPTHYASSFMTNAWWFLFISLFSILLICAIVWIFQSYYPVDRKLPFFNGKCSLKKTS